MTVKTSRQSCEIKTRTPSGAAWVRKYLHPPIPLPDGYCGIPDYNNSPSATPEYRCVQNLPCSVVSSTAPPVTRYFTSQLLLVMPSIVSPVACWSFNPSESLVGAGYNPNNLIVNPNINVLDLVNNYASWRMAYKSVTTDLNATAFTNQGVVTSALFRPNVFRSQIGSVIKRYGGADSIIHGIFNAFHDKSFHTLTADQKLQKLADGDLLSTTLQVVDLGTIPLNSTQVEMIGPNSVSTKATEGAYMVTPFSQPTTEYKSIAPGTNAPLIGETFTAEPCFNFWVERRPGIGAQEYQISPFTTAEPGVIPGTLSTNVPDLPWADMMWGWILYEGLSVSATTAASNPPPYITVKAISGAEYQPKPGSATAPYSHESAMPDRDALDIAALCAYGRTDALPSRENFLGTLFPLILKAAPAVIGALVSTFGASRKEVKEDNRVSELMSSVSKMATSLQQMKVGTAAGPTAIQAAGKKLKRKRGKMSVGKVSTKK